MIKRDDIRSVHDVSGVMSVEWRGRAHRIYLFKSPGSTQRQRRQCPTIIIYQGENPVLISEKQRVGMGVE